jgi:hypothetical protein
VALDLQSLTAWDGFFRPISWRFDSGIRTRLAPEAGSRHLDPEGVWRTQGGVGLSFALARDVTAYGFAEAAFDVGPSLAHVWSLGPGAALGLHAGIPGDRWRAHVYARATQFALGDRTTWLRVGAEQRLTLGRNSALELDAAYARDFGAGNLRSSLTWNLHF